MSTKNEKAAAESLITNYAKALNSADAASIPGFYTQDGRFLPDGFRSLTTTDLIKGSKSYLGNSRFRIEYIVQDIALEGPFAFIEAIAQASSVDVATGTELTQVSRDLFTLRKEQEEWKIFRYIFNKVKE